jgi:hypothetical protein
MSNKPIQRFIAVHTFELLSLRVSSRARSLEPVQRGTDSFSSHRNVLADAPTPNAKGDYDALLLRN